MDINFTIESLLDNPSFQNYALNRNPSDYDKWMQIYQEATPEDQRIMDDAVALYRELQEQDPYTNQAQNRVWSKITQDLQAPKKSTRTIPMYRWSAIAASILIFFGALFLFSNEDAEVTTSISHLSENLPDGSTVQLNSESSITYGEKSWDTERIVKLEGEAFFDVQKGSQFTVLTKNGTITVHGTSFNVYAREDQLLVRCFTGRVSVDNEHDEVYLERGDMATAIKQSETIQKSTFDAEQQDWRTGMFRFDHQKLGFVLDELSRQFGVRIKTTDTIRNMEYTGFFENADLEKALYSICWPLNLNSVIQDKTVIIEQNSH